VSERAERSLPLFGALALTVFMLVLMFGLREGAAALLAYARDLTLSTARGHVEGDILTLTIVQAVAMGGALLLGLRMFDPDAPLQEALAMRPVSPGVLALCLAAGACLQFPLTELANFLHAHVFGPEPLEIQLARQNLLEAHNLGQGLIVVGSVVGLVPLMEELLFRGHFLFGLSRRYGLGFGLLFSSILFGLAHVMPVAVVYAAVAGLVIGWLGLTTRSIWPGVALHAGCNALPVLLPERVLPIPGFNLPSAVPQHLPHWLVWPPLLAALLLLAAIHRIEYATER
jgi:membrane protease YdiL (CAAX protease family)